MKTTRAEIKMKWKHERRAMRRRGGTDLSRGRRTEKWGENERWWGGGGVADTKRVERWGCFVQNHESISNLEIRLGGEMGDKSEDMWEWKQGWKIRGGGGAVCVRWESVTKRRGGSHLSLLCWFTVSLEGQERARSLSGSPPHHPPGLIQPSAWVELQSQIYRLKASMSFSFMRKVLVSLSSPDCLTQHISSLSAIRHFPFIQHPDRC